MVSSTDITLVPGCVGKPDSQSASEASWPWVSGLTCWNGREPRRQLWQLSVLLRAWVAGVERMWPFASGLGWSGGDGRAVTLTKLAKAEYLLGSVVNGLEEEYLGIGKAPGVLPAPGPRSWAWKGWSRRTASAPCSTSCTRSRSSSWRWGLRTGRCAPSR